MTNKGLKYYGIPFEKLYNIAEYTSMTKEEQARYDQELKRKWDNAAVRAQNVLDGEMIGEERGEVRGQEKGRIKERKLLALEMKKKGYPISEIADLTKLTAEEIEQL